MSLWSLVLACVNPPMASEARCSSLSPGGEREQCWVELAPDLVRADAAAGEAKILAEVQDPILLDYVWLTVTREVAPETPRYCEKVRDEAIRTRCRTLVSRPHLHRALREGQGPGGPAGAQPAGPPLVGPPPSEEPSSRP